MMGRMIKDRCTRLALFAAFMLVVCAWTSSYADARTADGFCQEQVVRDFEGPITHLPNIHQFPRAGRLPFAPSDLRWDTPPTQILVAGRDTQVSYSFGSSSGAHRRFRLNWYIEGHLNQIDKQGKALKAIQEKRWRIGAISKAELDRLTFRFSLPSMRTLYRLNFTFRRHGDVLARYGEYFRMVKPTVSVKLAANQLSARVGETFLLRVENFGSTSVRYGEPFSIEKFDGLSWSPAPIELGPWRMNQHKLLGGMAGPCQTFLVPSSMPPGLYRFSKEIAKPAKHLTAEFEVRS